MNTDAIYESLAAYSLGMEQTEMKGGHAHAQAPMTLAQQNRAAKKAAFLLGLREDGTLGATCKRTGLAVSTIYRWRKNDAEFNQNCEDWLHDELEDVLHESMFQIATSTDPKMANASVRAGEFLLKALNPEQYGEKIRVDSTQSISVAISIGDQVRDQFRAEHATLRAQARALRTIDVLPLLAVEQR